MLASVSLLKPSRKVEASLAQNISQIGLVFRLFISVHFSYREILYSRLQSFAYHTSNKGFPGIPCRGGHCQCCSHQGGLESEAVHLPPIALKQKGYYNFNQILESTCTGSYQDRRKYLYLQHQYGRSRLVKEKHDGSRCCEP